MKPVLRNADTPALSPNTGKTDESGRFLLHGPLTGNYSTADSPPFEFSHNQKHKRIGGVDSAFAALVIACDHSIGQMIDIA